jgi:hypothetical protein
MIIGRGAGLAAAWLGIVLASGPAAAQSVELYELTESMTIVGKAPRQQRVATSQLMGFAQPGTPLCSPEVASSPAAVTALSKTTTRCVINATGSDVVSLRSGQGTLRGRLTVVIQGDNLVDSPELIVTTGAFRGEMDLSPAILHQIPFGLAEGVVTLEGGQTISFRATFRLPFDGNELVQGIPLRDLLCPGSSPNPELWGADIKYLATAGGVPNGQCIDVLPWELALGFPMVRLDIDF